MLENKFITQQEYDAAKKEVVVFKPEVETGITAPHFVLFVKRIFGSNLRAARSHRRRAHGGHHA